MHGEHRAFAYIQTPHIQFIHANSWKRIVRKSPNVVAYWRKKQTILTRCVNDEERLIFLSVFCFLFFMRTKNWQQQIEWESKIDCDGAMSTENFMLCIQRLPVNTEHEHGIMPSLPLLLNDLMLSHSNHEHFNTQTMKMLIFAAFLPSLKWVWVYATKIKSEWTASTLLVYYVSVHSVLVTVPSRMDR